MSEESANLGDVLQIYVEPFDQGKRAILVFEVKRPIHINGRPRTRFAGAILEEKQLLQLVGSLGDVADMRRAASQISRIIRL